MQYFSQCKQDEFIDKIVFNQKEGGYFIEIGAYDGITFSNTAFLEKQRKWRGICVEPMPNAFNKLKNNRKCDLINGCIYSKEGFVEFLHVEGASEMLSGIANTYDSRHCSRIDKEIVERGGDKKYIKVKAYNLNNLLDERNIKTVDFCSIDVEGGEWDVLQTIDFSKITIKSFTIENNYKDDKIKNFLISKNYTFIGNLEMDEIYVSKEITNVFSLKIWCKIYNFQLKLNSIKNRIM